MKLPRPHEKVIARSVSGFSLIELLTAMAVLAMLMALLLMITDGILRSTRLQSQQMDSTGAARRALDIVALDISRAIVSESAAILFGSSNSTADLAMLTDRRGTNITDHRFLAVTYDLDISSNQLLRTYRSVSFSETNLLSTAANSSNSATNALVNGVLAMSLRVLTPSGLQSPSNATTLNYATTTYNGFSVPPGWKALITTSPSFASGLTNRAQALDLWIAVVDDQNNKLLQDTEKLDLVKNALSNTSNPPALWRSEIDEADIPLPAKSAIQVLNKVIPLP
jgi:prepilin-type N-terminal cleavage/methylation domain-containing protein